MSDSDRVQNWRRHLNRMVNDEDGRKLLSDVLDVHFVDTDTSDKPIVAILVPSYGNMKPEAEKAITAMVNYSRSKGTLVHAPRVLGHSVIHWVRNELVARLWQDDVKFTHILFIDDDISPDPDALERLLSHGKDIVSALCTKRADPPVPTTKEFTESGSVLQKLHWSNHGGLVEFDGTGTGMILISRKALDATTEFYMNCGWERKMGLGTEKQWARISKMRREQFEKADDPRWLKNGNWFDFLPALNGCGQYSEDISFCWKAKMCGIPVYVDTAVTPRHWGLYGYSFEDFIAYKHQLIQEQKQSEQESQIVVVE